MWPMISNAADIYYGLYRYCQQYAGLSEKQRSEYLKITWEKARKLEKLINELFSFTKISYGGMPMRMEKIDVIKMLEQEADELYPTFKENELECLLETDADSCMIMADGEQLVRVFDNLLAMPSNTADMAR